MVASEAIRVESCTTDAQCLSRIKSESSCAWLTVCNVASQASCRKPSAAAAKQIGRVSKVPRWAGKTVGWITVCALRIVTETRDASIWRRVKNKTCLTDWTAWKSTVLAWSIERRACDARGVHTVKSVSISARLTVCGVACVTWGMITAACDAKIGRVQHKACLASWTSRESAWLAWWPKT